MLPVVDDVIVVGLCNIALIAVRDHHVELFFIAQKLLLIKYSPNTAYFVTLVSFKVVMGLLILISFEFKMPHGQNITLDTS